MPGFSERYRQTFNKRGSDWWHIIFGYPLARLLVVAVAPLRFVTPNGITLVGFAATMAGAWFLTRPGDAALAAAVALIQAGMVLDLMDGTLARIRGDFSPLGAFLDKALDAFSMFAMAAAVGVRAFWDTGQVWWTVCACAGGAAFVTLCYMYWVAKGVGNETVDAAEVAGVADAPGWGDIGREWLRGWPRIVQFEEGDLYFWICLGAVLGEWKWLALLLGVTQGVTVLYKLVAHSVRLART